MVKHIDTWVFLRLHGGINHNASKIFITEEFHRRLKLIWRPLLCGQYKVQATNCFCVPLLSYGFGMVEWTKAEISQFDIFVCELLTAANSHHPHSSIECLYLPRKIGGRGLVNIEHIFQRCLLSLSRHLQTSTDSLVHACCEVMSQFPPRMSLITRARDISTSLALDNIYDCNAEQLKTAVCAAQRKKLLELLCAKPFHGKFYTWT